MHGESGDGVGARGGWWVSVQVQGVLQFLELRACRFAGEKHGQGLGLQLFVSFLWFVCTTVFDEELDFELWTKTLDKDERHCPFVGFADGALQGPFTQLEAL